MFSSPSLPAKAARRAPRSPRVTGRDHQRQARGTALPERPRPAETSSGQVRAASRQHDTHPHGHPAAASRCRVGLHDPPGRARRTGSRPTTTTSTARPAAASSATTPSAASPTCGPRSPSRPRAGATRRADVLAHSRATADAAARPPARPTGDAGHARLRVPDRCARTASRQMRMAGDVPRLFDGVFTGTGGRSDWRAPGWSGRRRRGAGSGETRRCAGKTSASHSASRRVQPKSVRPVSKIGDHQPAIPARPGNRRRTSRPSTAGGARTGPTVRRPPRPLVRTTWASAASTTSP